MTRPRAKGNRPAGTSKTLPLNQVPNYELEHPKFCFRYTQQGNCPGDLDKDQRGALVLAMHKLAQIDWNTIKSSDRHASGTEFIPKRDIKASVPEKFADEDRFMFFRYHGKLPFGGIRVNDVFHILWVAKNFKDVYKH